MLLEELQKLSDEELISRIAVEVMGWERIADFWGHYHTLPDNQNEICAEAGWNPLTDWNHTMEVVKRMQAQGWHFAYEHFPKGSPAGFSVASFGRAIADDIIGQRAILFAALVAVQS